MLAIRCVTLSIEHRNIRTISSMVSRSLHIAFRVDASETIGAGHGMRCVTLAIGLKQRLKQLGMKADFHFVSTKSAQLLVSLYRQNGFLHSVVDTVDSSVDHIKADVWIVDHYQLDRVFEQTLTNRNLKVMVIDDLANRMHDCHLLLDTNFLENYKNRYNELVNESCRLLLGPSYAILREEFYALSEVQCKALRQILICFGGSDPHNMTMFALNALRLLDDNCIEANVVINDNHKARNEISEQIQRINSKTIHKVQLHINSRNMSHLMQTATLMIGAGGSMHWERCVIGLPAIIISVADNQRETSQYLADKNVCDYIGHFDEVGIEQLAGRMADLLRLPHRLSKMSNSAKTIIPLDKGTPKVCDEIISTFQLTSTR